METESAAPGLLLRTPTAHSAVLFTVCRYVVYGLLFVRGVLSARFLGPYYQGIYGFSSLVLQYLAYGGLGIQFAVNVELSTGDRRDAANTIGSAVTMTAFIGGGLLLFAVAWRAFHVHLFAKYSFETYVLFIAGIAALSMLQQVFTNVFRVYGKLVEIAAGELLLAGVLLVLTLMFRGQSLVFALLAGWLIAAFAAVLIFVIRAPFKLPLHLDMQSIRSMLALGFPLLVYNASFSVIAVIAQSVIGAYYSVETLGYYTLATNIASAVLLGFNSISWIVFPELLAKTREGIPEAQAALTADRVNVIFGTGAFLVVLVGIVLLPALFLFLPQYGAARTPLTILLLSEALLSCSTGYNCLAIARKRQIDVARLSMFSVLFVVVACWTIGANRLPFSLVALAVVGGSCLFTVLQGNLGYRLLSVSKATMRPILRWSSVTACVVCLAGTFLGWPSTGAMLALLFYLITNRDRVEELWNVCRPHIRLLGRYRGNRRQVAC